MRLFLAIELPSDVRQHLILVRDDLKSELSNLRSSRSKLSLTRDENLHITLNFLGEVDPGRLDELIESFTLVRASGKIELFARQMEFYPQRGPVRIVAAGFDGQLAALGAMHRSIEQRAQHLGFERESRPYRPHATLGRARPVLAPTIRNSWPTNPNRFPGPGFLANEFALMESRLATERSRYTVLHRFGIA